MSEEASDFVKELSKYKSELVGVQRGQAGQEWH
jgi:hypothetical protein